MEFLKKILVLAVLLANMQAAYSQNSSTLEQAFSQSYTKENAGEYDRAIDALKKVYNEKSYAINIRLGWLYYLSGRFTDGLAYYQKAIRLMPQSIEARLGLVYPASALGNWEQVKNAYLEILKIDPGHSIANYRLGLIYYGREQFATAIRYFEKVANYYPFDYDANLMYGWTCLKLGKYREARVLFNNALMVKPDDKSAKEGLSFIK